MTYKPRLTAAAIINYHRSSLDPWQTLRSNSTSAKATCKTFCPQTDSWTRRSRFLATALVSQSWYYYFFVKTMLIWGNNCCCLALISSPIRLRHCPIVSRLNIAAARICHCYGLGLSIRLCHCTLIFSSAFLFVCWSVDLMVLCQCLCMLVFCFPELVPWVMKLWVVD